MVLSLFFGSKIEKDLKAMAAEHPECEVAYAGSDEEAFTATRMIRVVRDSVVILGFPGKLKQRQLRIRSLFNGLSFETTLTGQSKDKLGQLLFHCKMPEKLMPTPGFRRYKVYPNGSAKIILSTNRGETSVNLPLWEVSEFGITLVNNTRTEVKVGTRLYQSMVQVGGGQAHLVDMQVANIRLQQLEDKKFPLLICGYSKPPRGLTEMVGVAKTLAPKPPPPKKK